MSSGEMGGKYETNRPPGMTFDRKNRRMENNITTKM
jgi:hypothetical protein